MDLNVIELGRGAAAADRQAVELVALGSAELEAGKLDANVGQSSAVVLIVVAPEDTAVLGGVEPLDVGFTLAERAVACLVAPAEPSLAE